MAITSNTLLMFILISKSTINGTSRYINAETPATISISLLMCFAFLAVIIPVLDNIPVLILINLSKYILNNKKQEM